MKKLISLLLVLAMLLLVFASCGDKDKDDNGDDQSSSVETSGDNTNDEDAAAAAAAAALAAKKAALKALSDDLKVAMQKFTSSSKFTVTTTVKVTAPTEDDKTATVEIPVTVKKDGGNLVLSGDLSSVMAMMPSETDGDADAEPIDPKFEISYIDSTLYIVIPAAGANMYMEDVAYDDVKELVASVGEILHMEIDLDAIVAMAGNAVNAVANGMLIDAIASIDFSNCADIDAVLKEALTKLLPVAAFVQYGENWKIDFPADNDGMTIEQWADGLITKTIKPGIPPAVLAVLNSNEVMTFIKSEFVNYIEISSATKDGVTTHTLTIKKELFQDIAKIANKFTTLFDRNMVVVANTGDITLAISLDGDKNITGCSFKLDITKISIPGMFEMKDYKIDLGVGTSSTADTITAPDKENLGELDKDEIFDFALRFLDEYVNGPKPASGENVFDGYELELTDGLAMSYNDEDTDALLAAGYKSWDAYFEALYNKYSNFTGWDLEQLSYTYDSETGAIVIDDEHYGVMCYYADGVLTIEFIDNELVPTLQYETAIRISFIVRPSLESFN